MLSVPKAFRRERSQVLLEPFHMVFSSSWCTVMMSSGARFSVEGVMSFGRRDPWLERKMGVEWGSFRRSLIWGSRGVVSRTVRLRRVLGELARCTQISPGLAVRFGFGCLPCFRELWKRVMWSFLRSVSNSLYFTFGERLEALLMLWGHWFAVGGGG
jgi:hypothetical protein